MDGLGARETVRNIVLKETVADEGASVVGHAVGVGKIVDEYSHHLRVPR